MRALRFSSILIAGTLLASASYASRPDPTAPPLPPPPPNAQPVLGYFWGTSNVRVVWAVYGAWPGTVLQVDDLCGFGAIWCTGLYELIPLGIDAAGATVYMKRRADWTFERALQAASDASVRPAPQSVTLVRVYLAAIGAAQGTLDRLAPPHAPPAVAWTAPFPALLLAAVTLWQAIQRRRAKRALELLREREGADALPRPFSTDTPSRSS